MSLETQIEHAEGEAVRVIARGRIIDVSNAHGLCYLVELPQRDFREPRRIWLDADEIEGEPQ